MKLIRKVKAEMQEQKVTLQPVVLPDYYGAAILDILEQPVNATKLKKLERLPL
jgi:hypothetical protein